MGRPCGASGLPLLHMPAHTFPGLSAASSRRAGEQGAPRWRACSRRMMTSCVSRQRSCAPGFTVPRRLRGEQDRAVVFAGRGLPGVVHRLPRGLLLRHFCSWSLTHGGRGSLPTRSGCPRDPSGGAPADKAGVDAAGGHRSHHYPVGRDRARGNLGRLVATESLPNTTGNSGTALGLRWSS